jgi:hypothetical protein
MGVYKGVTTSELDELAAETAAHLTSEVGLAPFSSYKDNNDDGFFLCMNSILIMVY